jgi:APA family basic amino acid/polyamine antiporter
MRPREGGILSTDVAEPGSGSRGKGGPSLEVFSRRSSGFVRELSLVDTAWYGILAAGALFGLLYVFPYPQTTLLGLNVPIAVLIAMVLMVPVFALYAGLGSAMPRTGGDYLYQSRALHPLVGFSFTVSWEVLMWVTFTTTGGLVVSTLGFQPLLYNLGLSWESKGLIDAANWFGSVDGILITTLTISVLAFIVTIMGLGFYRKIQRTVIVPAIVISNIVLVILLLRSKESFIEKFNAYHQKALGESDFYGKVQATITDSGFQNPGFSLKYTLLFLSITGITWYVVFAAQGLLGEAKKADNFGRLFKVFMIGGLYVGLVAWILPVLLFQRMVGGDFMNGYAAVQGSGEVLEPAGGSIPAVAMMMTSNPIVSILLAIGFIAVGFYFAVCVFLNMTRVMTAMGMDRTLPAWFSKVSERFHAPVNAAIVYLVLAVGLNLWFRYDEGVRTTLTLGGAFTGTGIIAITGLAGVFFAYRNKAVYEVSPVAKHTIFGLPLIAVAGAITFLAAGGVTVANLFVPELGFTTGSARIAVLLTVVVAAIWYVGNRAYLKRKGVDIDLAFKQVPPE